MKKVFVTKKNSCKVTFSLPKEATLKGKKVSVLGDFNEWNPESAIALSKKKDGSFSKVVELEVGKDYEFRFLVDNERWENAWDADSYVQSPYMNIQNSVVSLTNVDSKTSEPIKKSAKTIVKTAKKRNASADKSTKAPKAAKSAKSAKPAAKATKATKSKSAKAATATVKVKASKKSKVASTKVKATKSTKKSATKADDLTKVEGVGPKIAGLLVDAGIKSFALLAKASSKKLTSILDAAGPRYKMHNPKSWPEQAKLAKNGEWDKLQKLQDKLKGGVK